MVGKSLNIMILYRIKENEIIKDVTVFIAACLITLSIIVGILTISSSVHSNKQQEMLQLCLDYGYSAYHDGACYSNMTEAK